MTTTATACAALLASLTISIFDSPSRPDSVIFEACDGARCERIRIPKKALNTPDMDEHLEGWLKFVFCK